MPSTLVPTKYRERLPKGWAYPIGAEKLSEIFRGVVQYDKLTIRFTAREKFFASDQHALLTSGKPITVLQLEYRNDRPGLSSSNDMIASGQFYGEHWKITVYAVPASSKAAAQQTILSFSDQLRKWLEVPRTATWKDGSHHCSIHVLLPDCEGTIASR